MKNSFSLNWKDLYEFKTNLVNFYKETREIKLTNEKQKKDIEHREVVLDKVSKLYNMLLKIYTNKFNRSEKKKKKKIAIQNRPETLSLKGLYPEDHKTLEGDKTLEHDKE